VDITVKFETQISRYGALSQRIPASPQRLIIDAARRALVAPPPQIESGRPIAWRISRTRRAVGAAIGSHRRAEMFDSMRLYEQCHPLILAQTAFVHNEALAYELAHASPRPCIR